MMKNPPADPNAVLRYDERRAGLLKDFTNKFIDETTFLKHRFQLELAAFGPKEAKRKYLDYLAEIAAIRNDQTQSSTEYRTVIGPLSGIYDDSRQEPDEPLDSYSRDRRKALLSLPGLGAIAWLLGRRR